VHQNNYEVEMRTRRATRNPGFFRTLFSVIYEQWNDTRNTFGTVNKLINDNFVPENAPVSNEVTEATTASDPNITTTEAPFRISRTEFNKIVRRNLRGLQRLYNIELQDALKMKDKAYTKYQHTKSPIDLELYKDMRNYLSIAIRNERNAYINHQIKINANNPRKLWKDFSSWNVHVKPKSEISEELRDPTLINDFFINKVQEININQGTLNSYVNETNLTYEQYELEPITPDKIEQIVKENEIQCIWSRWY
ncbi:hypothetical protein NQ314_019504, partial [Rhamnusium bicolor]